MQIYPSWSAADGQVCFFLEINIAGITNFYSLMLEQILQDFSIFSYWLFIIINYYFKLLNKCEEFLDSE